MSPIFSMIDIQPETLMFVPFVTLIWSIPRFLHTLNSRDKFVALLYTNHPDIWEKLGRPVGWRWKPSRTSLPTQLDKSSDSIAKASQVNSGIMFSQELSGIKPSPEEEISAFEIVEDVIGLDPSPSWLSMAPDLKAPYDEFRMASRRGSRTFGILMFVVSVTGAIITIWNKLIRPQ